MLLHPNNAFQYDNSSPQAIHGILRLRSTTSNHALCVDLDAGKIVISRTTLIAAIAVCIIITCISLLTVAIFIYREWKRCRQTQAATAWSRSQRISVMRKEIDDQYSRQYSGYLYQEPENPFMRSESPVELMHPEHVCEAPATPPPTVEGSSKGKNSRISLLFDPGVGLWMPKK